MASNEQRREVYNALKSLGASTGYAKNKSTWESVKEFKALVAEYDGNAKFAEGALRPKSASSWTQEETKQFAKLQQELNKFNYDITATLTTTEKQELNKMIKDGRTEEVVKRLTSSPVFDKAAREKQYRAWARGDAKQTATERKTIASLNAKLGLPANHSQGVVAYRQMHLEGKTEVQALDFVRKNRSAANPTMLIKTK